MLSHLPITLSIAAAGAAMVSLIGHAGDARTPAGTAWLLVGAVALGLVALIFTEKRWPTPSASTPSTGPSASRWRPARSRRWSPAGPRPAPWLLGLVLVAILSVLWIYAASRFLRTDAWST
jgi:hypothetical protein